MAQVFSRLKIIAALDIVVKLHAKKTGHLFEVL